MRIETIYIPADDDDDSKIEAKGENGARLRMMCNYGGSDPHWAAAEKMAGGPVHMVSMTPAGYIWESE